ncbi:aminoglycoside phosphotransferase family protein [Romeria aff. gracilis LEGE 07310]|uniref:Aminoglycoside phosphotransferase family protein n=1 Tax=Vasconcelosia minhoensis LEGE 07310 TaxID=915328 RepID=A0A8J7DLM8_9CYAN|nr:aminoglycoside phosphotransferase family protein [Romeria gracilis]MBE9077316.1 aminoglycoside phosphotransferase family protein [Romeria aff. gracilis LEGE 07310]
MVDVQPLGNGNINRTFLVTAAPTERFVLQQINTQVFPQPERIMQNIRVFTEHVRDRVQTAPSADRWEVPQVRLTQAQQPYWIDAEDAFWRAISFIENTQTVDQLQTLDQASAVGAGLGRFHHLISDLPPAKLADTLEGFHITPRYLEQYAAVLAKTSPPPTAEVTHCLEFIEARQSWASVLETAKAQGKLPLRPIHGDPKVNNVLLDAETGQAVGLIDLDTIKPGLVHYDIGDCLRSGCNRLGEETEQWEAVRFDADFCQAILQSYLAAARSFFQPADYDYLYDAIRLIAFELGLRFFTDYLAGNVYFKVHHPEHNLLRALVQFQLTQSIESQAETLHQLIQELR